MISVSTHGVFHVHNISQRVLERACSSVMETLVCLEEKGGNVSDAALSVDLETKIVEIELVGHGKDFAAARSAAESAVHSAIHKVGGRLTKRVHTRSLNAELVEA